MLQIIIGLFMLLGLVGNIDTNAEVPLYVNLALFCLGTAFALNGVYSIKK